MIQVYLNTSEFNKISELLPDICPEVKFILKAQDDNLVKIGLAESAPCIIEFDTSVEDFYDMLDTLNDIEIDAFNTNDIEPSERNTDYQKYLKFGCLYDILYTAKRTYPTIGKVKYVGKSFGVDSLTDGKIYDVVSVKDGFLRVIDDSDEDYLYSCGVPSSLEKPDLCGKWVVIEDSQGILKEYIK